MGVPQARWMIDFIENILLKWMMTGGTPILGNLEITRHIYMNYQMVDYICLYHRLLGGSTNSSQVTEFTPVTSELCNST